MGFPPRTLIFATFPLGSTITVRRTSPSMCRFFRVAGYAGFTSEITLRATFGLLCASTAGANPAIRQNASIVDARVRMMPAAGRELKCSLSTMSPSLEHGQIRPQALTVGYGWHMNKITEVPEEISSQWPVISGQF